MHPASEFEFLTCKFSVFSGVFQNYTWGFVSQGAKKRYMRASIPWEIRIFAKQRIHITVFKRRYNSSSPRQITTMSEFNYNANGVDYDPDLIYDRPRRREHPDRQLPYNERFNPERNETDYARRDREYEPLERAPQPRRRRKTTDPVAENRINDNAGRPVENRSNHSAKIPAKEARQKKPRAPRKPLRDYGIIRFLCDKRFHAVLGVALVFAAVYISVAAISFFRSGAEDQSVVTSRTVTEITSQGIEVENAAGPVGARLAQSIIVEGLGLGSIALIAYMVLLGLAFMGLRKMSFWSLTFKTLLVAICTSLVLGLFSLWVGTDYNLGGYHGQYVNLWLVAHCDWIGAALVSAFAIVSVFYVYINDIYVLLSRYRAMRRARREKAEQLRLEREEDRERVREAMELADRREQTDSEEDDDPRNPQDDVSDHTPVPVGFEETEDYGNEDPYAITDHARYMPPITPEPEMPSSGHIPGENAQEEKNEELIASHSEEPSIPTPAVAAAEATATPVAVSPVPPTPAPLDVIVAETIEEGDEGKTELYDPTAELSHYCKPSVELLRDIPQKENNVDIDEQEENQARIRKTLNDYGIEISKIKATVGPTVTLYEIIPAEGVRIAKIKRLEDDIALSLAALGIRIIAPMPGKGTIGIEVPNKDPQTVSIRSILSSKRFLEGKETLPMAMGATISNEVFVADLCKMPHLLVAGATGMGKSVGLNAIIASLLYKCHPAELKFVLIDPKMVEFSLYSVLEKHFLAKLPDEEEAVVTQMDKVLATLNSLCVEMDNRLTLLRDANVRSIAEYNEKFIQKRLNPNNGHRFLPYIVVIVDEFADLIMVAGKEVEKPVARIAQKARAVGIHMIVATQRPSTDVITGLIKNNFPGRIAFRVTQMVDSKTILDRPGANQLIGRGDMLFSHNGALTRVQCAFIDTPEVQAICEHIERQAAYPTAYLLPEPVMEPEGGSMVGSGNLSDRDVLFNEVAEAIVQSGFGSTSSVQRRFQVGFARAGKIMDQLEAAGIVGPATGGKPRQVLVDMMGLQDILRTLS